MNQDIQKNQEFYIIEINPMLGSSYRENIVEKFMDYNFKLEHTLCTTIVGLSLDALNDFGNEQYYEKFQTYYEQNQKKLISINKDNQNKLHKMISKKVSNSLFDKIGSTAFLEEIVEAFISELKSIAMYHKELDKKETVEALEAKKTYSEKEEIEHIINFVKNHWDGLDKFDSEAMLKMVWSEGLKAGKQVIDDNAIFNEVKSWNEERNDLTKWLNNKNNLKPAQIQKALKLDYINKFTTSLIITTIMERGEDNWDYEKICNKILNKVKELYPEASRAKPKCWKELSKNYKEYDGMDEYSKNEKKKDEQEFKGINSGSAASYNFPQRVSVAHVMYDDKEQGRKSLETLIGAVIGHVYAFVNHNNAAKIVKNIADLREKLSAEKYQTIVSEIKFIQGEPTNEFEIDISSYANKTKNLINLVQKKVTIASPEEIEEFLIEDKKTSKKTIMR